MRSTRTASTDSLPSPPMSPNSSNPSLRKRQSSYMRSPDPATSPIPELLPHRPPRNPARQSTHQSSFKSKSSSRPSSSRSAREEVTPWEFQSTAVPEERPRLRSGAQSVKSKASSLGLAGTATGPVEDVTPWELMPAPAAAANSPKPPSLSNQVLAPLPVAPSPSTLHPTKLTGLVEDVTPWELHSEPEPSVTPVPPQSSPPMLPRSKPPSILSNSSVQGYRQSTATGPAEEVTPWEVQLPPTHEQPPPTPPVPPLARHSLSMTKAQLEEVMPWELVPAPPLPVTGGTSSLNSKHSGTIHNVGVPQFPFMPILINF